MVVWWYPWLFVATSSFNNVCHIMSKHYTNMVLNWTQRTKWVLCVNTTVPVMVMWWYTWLFVATSSFNDVQHIISEHYTNMVLNWTQRTKWVLCVNITVPVMVMWWYPWLFVATSSFNDVHHIMSKHYTNMVLNWTQRTKWVLCVNTTVPVMVMWWYTWLFVATNSFNDVQHIISEHYTNMVLNWTQRTKWVLRVKAGSQFDISRRKLFCCIMSFHLRITAHCNKEFTNVHTNTYLHTRNQFMWQVSWGHIMDTSDEEDAQIAMLLGLMYRWRLNRHTAQKKRMWICLLFQMRKSHNAHHNLVQEMKLADTEKH